MVGGGSLSPPLNYDPHVDLVLPEALLSATLHDSRRHAVVFRDRQGQSFCVEVRSW